MAFFDDGGFEARLAELVAVPSTSQDPGHDADLLRYLQAHIRPLLERISFTAELHANPVPGFGPILLAERTEGAGPTVLTYGYGNPTSCIGMRGLCRTTCRTTGTVTAH